MTPEERLTLRIDPELKNAARAKAEAEDLTLSQAVRRLLRRWLEEDQLESPEEETTEQE
jgi:antitoxin component of RelBE/YafQ-DinJ toxin-antitoxin module